MRKSYNSFSFDSFLKDLREEIRFSKHTQQSIANCMNIRRETLCKKLNRSAPMTAEQLYKIMVALGLI